MAFNSIEVSLNSLSPEHQEYLMNRADNSLTMLDKGESPLEILMRLEQLAFEEGFEDIHEYISYYLQRENTQ